METTRYFLLSLGPQYIECDRADLSHYDICDGQHEDGVYISYYFDDSPTPIAMAIRGDSELISKYVGDVDTGRPTDSQNGDKTMDTRLKFEPESLKKGHYGNVELIGIYGDYTLYNIEIADPYADDIGWECGEWYIVDADGHDRLLARCDGYSGINWEIADEEILELLEGDEDIFERLKAAVRPYIITGQLLAEAQAETKTDATEDSGECCIWVTPHYYATHINAPVADYLRDDDNEIRVFASYADAQAWIERDNDGRYYLSQGEASRPDYRIIEAY